jgi:hypothetical protein
VREWQTGCSGERDRPGRCPPRYGGEERDGHEQEKRTLDFSSGSIEPPDDKPADECGGDPRPGVQGPVRDEGR